LKAPIFFHPGNFGTQVIFVGSHYFFHPGNFCTQVIFRTRVQNITPDYEFFYPGNRASVLFPESEVKDSKATIESNWKCCQELIDKSGAAGNKFTKKFLKLSVAKNGQRLYVHTALQSL
jgi:hypothetical protein